MSVDVHTLLRKSFINCGKVRVPVLSYVTSNDDLNLHYNWRYSIIVEQGIHYWMERQAWSCVRWIAQHWIQHMPSSVKKNSVQTERHCRSVCPPADLSETHWWRITPHLASVQHVGLHSALWSLLHRFFVVWLSPSSNDHSGVVANCDHMSECGHLLCACIGIEMRWVTQWKSLLGFLLSAHEVQFCLHWLYTLCQVTRSMWQLTNLRAIPLSPDLLQVAITGLTYLPLTMFPTLNTFKWTAAGPFLTCTNFRHRVYRHCGERQG